MNLHRIFVFCVCLPLLAACPAPVFREYGERQRAPGGGASETDPLGLQSRAFRRPRIEASQPDVLGGRPAPWTVVSHAPHGDGQRLVLAPEAGEPVTLDYAIADGLVLPVAPGERLAVSVPLDGSGLMVRELQGALRALVSIDGGLSGEVGFTVEGATDPSRLAYSEVVSLRQGCLVAVEHVDLVLRDGDILAYIPPGSTRSLELVATDERPRLATPTTSEDGAAELPKSRRYDLVALDASRATGRRADAPAVDESRGDEARCPSLAHTSWLLMLAR